jgi:hypothetical protein
MIPGIFIATCWWAVGLWVAYKRMLQLEGFLRVAILMDLELDERWMAPWLEAAIILMIVLFWPLVLWHMD